MVMTEALASNSRTVLTNKVVITWIQNSRWLNLS